MISRANYYVAGRFLFRKMPAKIHCHTLSFESGFLFSQKRETDQICLELHSQQQPVKIVNDYILIWYWSYRTT